MCFNPSDFDENGIHFTHIIEDKYFQWKRVPELFQAPLLLIKKNIGKESIPVIFSETNISYRNEVIGIHASEKDVDLLKNIEKIIKNNILNRFYTTLISTRSEISRSRTTLLQQDILCLPFVENSDIMLSKADEIIVNDVVNYYLKGEKEILSNLISESEIKQYSSVFCKVLNSIYQTEEKSFQLFKILDAGKYYALHFEYSSEKIKETKEITADLEQYIETVIPSRKEEQKKTHIQRIMKYYGKDCIILVKPKQLRYWLPSIALRDADEVFADYYKSRYPNA